MQSSLVLVEQALQNYNVPLFLHRLIMILSEENNEFIEWRGGKYAISFVSLIQHTQNSSILN